MPWNTKVIEPVKHEKSKIIGLKESGLAIVSGASSTINRSPGRPKGEKEEPLKPFLQYVTAYKNIPLVAAAIDRTVDFVVSPGFYVTSDNQEAKDLIDKFIDDMDFDIFLRNVVKDMLIFGDSFVEIVQGKNGIKELKVISPENMKVKRTRTGDVVGYIQDLGLGVKNPQWRPDKIAHFVYNRVGHSPYGTSIIHPILNILKLKIEMEESMGQIMRRKASAPIHVKMGSDEYPATQEDIDAMAADLQSLNNKTEWVTGHTVDMDVIGFKSKIIDIEPFTTHMDNQMVYGLQVPYVLLGTARIPEGLARVQLEGMDRRAKSIQMNVEQQLERKIFKKVLEANGMFDVKVEFEWGSPSQQMFTDEVMQYISLLKTPMTNSTKTEIENRIRKLLRIDGKITEDDYNNIQFKPNNADKSKTDEKRINDIEKKVKEAEALDGDK